MLNENIKEAYLIAVVIPSSHKLSTTIIEKLQKYAEGKEELARTCQLNAVYTVPLELSTTCIIPKKLCYGLNTLRPGLYYSQADNRTTPYLPHSSEVIKIMNQKCLVSDKHSLKSS